MDDAPPKREKIRRLLAGAIVAASLLLCLAAAGLWVRGYSTADTLMWRTGYVVAEDDWQRLDYMTRSHRGRLVFWRTGRVMNENELGRDAGASHAMLAAEPAIHYWMNDSRVFRAAWPEPAKGALGWLGLRWRAPIGGTSAQFGVPLWMLVTVTAVLPALLAVRLVQSRRAPATVAILESHTG